MAGRRLAERPILLGVDQCAECGFAYPSVSAADLPRQLIDAGAGFVATLVSIDDVRRRPAPAVWSPLEYACHVRDVLRVQNERLALALRTDNPPFRPMDRDELAVRNIYNDQDPQAVRVELTTAASRLALAFGALGPAQWSRTGIYNWPTVEARTMLWLGRHTLHELVHHRLDLTL
ncbi:MAG TPA: DinB family protein [Actinoplanes sp.]|jgi:S-DNA-T family DNA segregation ATPase FtsK/SpoIIIE